ncbi:MAG: PEP-CTERM sorting domain-containing protein [Acidobacteriaceae bacterium]|nr:PEP-CTERM sorting domain-containing protein [Acidobacteriaceae bacterium]
MFEFVGPNFLSGDNFFTANQLNGCFIGGLVAGSIYGSSCGGISIDVSGNTVGIDEFYGTGQGQPAAGATFTVPSDQFGTWSVFELPATFPAGTVGSSVLTISSTPEPATVILTALALLTFLARCLWRYSRAKPIDVW